MTRLAAPGQVTAEQLLRTRVQRADAELAVLAGWLGQGPVVARMPETARARCVTLVRELRRELATLLGPTTPADALTWAALSRVEERAQQLATEVLAFVLGVCFAQARLGPDLAGVVQHLLTGLATRCRLDDRVLLAPTASGEAIDHTLDLVRLRLPGTSVWELPVAAHEFGHHVTREFRPVDGARFRDRPLLDLAEAPLRDAARTASAEQLREAAVEAAHRHELVADAFATVALGVAYPVSCIALRVPPGSAGQDTATHPSWARRVGLMTAVLQEMSRHAGTPRLSGAVPAVVRPLWRRLVPGVTVEPPVQAALDRLAEQVVGHLVRNTDGLLYDAGDQAAVVAAHLAQVAVGKAPAQLPVGCTVAHVLDGAWRWRLDHWDTPVAAAAAVDAAVHDYTLAAGP